VITNAKCDCGLTERLSSGKQTEYHYSLVIEGNTVDEMI